MDWSRISTLLGRNLFKQFSRDGEARRCDESQGKKKHEEEEGQEIHEPKCIRKSEISFQI